MTCAHPPGVLACPRCHEYRRVGPCIVCHKLEQTHDRTRVGKTLYIECPRWGYRAGYGVPLPLE